MSKIKELKSNTQNSINIIDILELFSPEKKSKYTDTLIRLMKNTRNLDEHVMEIKTNLMSSFDFIRIDDLNQFSDIQLMMTYRFLDSFFNFEDLKNIESFVISMKED